LTPETVFVEVDGYGTHALVVAETGGDGYQANCLRPPGLEPGRHEVRIRTIHSGRSNPAEFTMLDESGRDVLTARDSLPIEPPELCSAEFRPSGDLRYSADRGGSLVCYFRSNAESVAAASVIIDVAGLIVQAHTISSLGGGVWQANILLDRPLAPGTAIRIRLGEGEWSMASPARQVHQ
jgi:hypothetical protein